MDKVHNFIAGMNMGSDEENNDNEEIELNQDVINPSVLMDLPSEMWEIIFTKLTTKDALNLRLVNQKCKCLASNLYDGWIIRLDDRWEEDENRGSYMNGLLHIRAKEVKVISLLKPLPVLLKYPDFIQVISMDRRKGNDGLCDCVISPENLHVLLQSKSIKHVSLQLVFATLKSAHYSSNPPLIGYDFRNLHHLQIGLFPSNEESGLELMEYNLLSRILGRSMLPNLRSLKLLSILKYSPAVKFVLAVEIQRFLSKYGQNMKELEIVFYPDDWESIDSPFLAGQHPHFRNCSSLQSLKLFLQSCTNGWRVLLQNQKELVHLDVSFPISSKLCGVITAKNFRTLTSIDIFCIGEVDDSVMVNGEEFGRFNFAIFQNCQVLKKLILRKNLSEVREFVIRNMVRLPEKIEHLDLSGFLIPSEDLLTFSTNRRGGTSLVTLNIATVGFTGPYGVNGTVLEDMLTLDSVLKIQVRWGSINRSDPEEFLKLQNIFSTFGHAYDFPEDSPLYERFDVIRDPVTLNFIY